ncbi:MAG: preprotein translocase subunit SecG [Candidatus Cloacimonetes bacterium]|nr:preprotein translocase subunit SecG [Candidatus Cloacimonadota bacterium]
MYIFLTVIHVIVSIALILVILAQSSKGGALDGMVGGVASNVLGGQGASKFLKNATRILAFAFMVICILLAFQLKERPASASTKAVDMLKEQEAQKETPLEEELPSLPLTDQPVPGEQDSE